MGRILFIDLAALFSYTARMKRTLCFSALLAFVWTLPPALSAEEPFFTSDRKVTLAALREFPRLGNDFSGAVYDPQSQRYWIVDDRCKMFEFSFQDGRLEHKRTVKLKGLEDCEDLVIFEDGSFAVTEERRGNLAFFSAAPETGEIRCPKDCRMLPVDQVWTLLRQNSGLEGLALNGGVLYAGKEDFPRKIYKITPRQEGYEITQPWNAEEKLPAGSDLAGMTFFEGSLFILDEPGEKIRQVDPLNGKILSSYALPHSDMPRHRYEGIAMARKGNTIEMLIAAEKHEVRIYEMGV